MRQPWTVTHRGLEYPGEAIVAEMVDPAWGQPLHGDVCFRIVLYTVPRRIPAGQIRDPRIAMAVPRRSADPTRTGLTRELQAIREARVRYLAGPDPELRAVGGSMAEQEASLGDELARREALSYAQGRIYSHSSTTVAASEVFVEPSANSWVEGLTHRIFQQAYPDLPFEHGEFPATLTAGGIQEIYSGLFQGDHEAIDIAAAFGPALGLATRSAPTRFDATGCKAVDVIEGELATRGGEAPAGELLELLCAEYGLNWALSTLYLLAYVRREHAEVELRPSHPVSHRNGGPFLSDRISSDLLPDLSFTPSIGDHLGLCRSQGALSWNAVVPYASLLVEGLELAQDPNEISEQEGRLLAALGEMGRRVDASRQAMSTLADALNEDVSGAFSTLDRLEVLSAAAGYRGFHAVALDSFDGPSDLSMALDLYRRLDQLSTLVPRITRRRRYLDDMALGREHGELKVKRDSLAARTGLNSLLEDPSLWDSVEESYRQLLQEYTELYLSHHSQYHQDAVELTSFLERLGPQVEALASFNEVAEFGGPLAADVPERFSAAMATVKACAASEAEVSLEAAPACLQRQLRLDEDISRRETALVFRDTERAMRVYNRRLSSEGVARILAHPTKEQLEKFVALVQVGDLSALANVLDDEVIEFLRRFVTAE